MGAYLLQEAGKIRILKTPKIMQLTPTQSEPLHSFTNAEEGLTASVFADGPSFSVSIFDEETGEKVAYSKMAIPTEDAAIQCAKSWAGLVPPPSRPH